MNKQRGFVGILVLIVVLIAASVGGYFVYNNLQENAKTQKEINDSLRATPTPTASPVTDETANWKTFVSNEYKFEVKYPSDVKYDQVLDTSENNKSHEFFRTDGGELEIYGVCGRGITPIKQQEITVGGQDTVKFYETEINGVIKAISRPNSNESICFNFKLPKDSSRRDSTDKLFDQILSTFKFTQ